MTKPAIDRDRLAGDIGTAASILASIDELVSHILVGNDDSGAMTAAIRTLAREAHDLLDVAVRALGDPGIGFRGRVAQRLDEQLPKRGRPDATS